MTRDPETVIIGARPTGHRLREPRRDDGVTLEAGTMVRSAMQGVEHVTAVPPAE